MKAVLLVVVALCVCALALPSEDVMRAQFIEFQHKYGKVYATVEDFELRFAVFKHSLARAEKRQTNTTKAKWGVTKFSDMTPEEFKNTILMKNIIPNHRPKKYPAKFIEPIPLATTFDWRNHSPAVVTPVYNQGQCGSCWAFSITENIESQWALAGNALTSLSMQQVVSCDTNDGGCNGGDPPTAYEYVVSAGGLEPYSDFPYTSEGGSSPSCSFNQQDVLAHISSYTQINEESQAQQYLVQNGPLSVCVDASSWSEYQGGIITAEDGCGTSLDHCVGITGYGSQENTNYWWVRNSWGTDWGQSGYLQVQSGADVCGIGQEITSATGA